MYSRKKTTDTSLLPYWGSLLYRAGEFQQAASVLEEVVTGDVEGSSTTYFRYFLAMAYHSLGENKRATEQLELANSDAEEELQGNPAWNRKLTLELLRDEAQQLLESESNKQFDDDSSARATDSASTL